MPTKFGVAVIFSLLLCLALPASAQVQLSIQAKPAQLLAKPGKRIKLIMQATDDQLQGRSGLEIRLDASAGKLGPVKDEGQGRYSATLRLPKRLHPQAILVAAKLPGQAPVWTVVKLRSKVKLPVNTDKPRVQVTLKLGGRSYGPVRTDARGRVKIQVEVAPGEFEAVAVAKDEFGNRSRRKVKIPIPTSPSLAGFAERDQLAADGQDGSDITLVAIRPDGSPDRERRFKTAIRNGRISGARMVAPGLYKLRFTAPKGLKQKKAKLKVMDEARPKANRRSFSFRLTAGIPHRLSLSAEPQELVADGKSSARFTMRLVDRAGNPLAGQGIELSCAKGFTSKVRDRGDGNYEADFTAPLHQRGSAGCKARLASGKLSAQATLSLLPPVPEKLLVTSEKKQLPQDGRSHTRIQIQIQDKQGNPLEGVMVRAKAPLGGLDTVSEDGNGRYHLHYTAPRGELDTRVRIQIEAGSGKKVLRKNLLIDLTGIVPPRPPAPMFSLGPSAAFLTNFARIHSGGVTLDLAWSIPGLGGYLSLDLESGYRFGQNSQTLFDGGSLDTRVEFVPLHLSLLCKPWPRHPVTAVLGLGGGAEFVQWSVGTADGSIERNHDILLGALGTLGVEARWGPGAIFLHARYLYAFLRDDAPLSPEGTQSTHIKGNIGGLDILLGYHLFF